MSTIVDIQAREILDSRGNPTVEVDVMLCGGAFGRAAVPSGASTGEHEAIELARRRQETLSRQRRHQGRQECHADRSCPALRGLDALRPTDRGPTPCSSSTARKPSRSWAPMPSSPFRWPTPRPPPPRSDQPLFKYLGGPNAKVLPVPMANVINGGAHSDAPIDFQEFMIMPQGLPHLLRGPARHHRNVPCAQRPC